MTLTDPLRSAWTLALASLVLSTAACGGGAESGEPIDLPSSDASTEASSSATSGPGDDAVSAGMPEPSLPPRNGEPVTAEGSRSYALQLPEEEPAATVAGILVDYADVRTTAFNQVAVDLAALSRVAMGEPLNQVQMYTSELEQRKNHVVGDSWFKIPASAVQIKGNIATVAAPACVLNASAEVSRQGVAVESPPSAYRVAAKLLKAGRDAWVVTEFSAEPANDCSW